MRQTIYNNMVIEGNKIRIFFDYVGGGLLIRGDRLNTFEISDRDGVFILRKR